MAEVHDILKRFWGYDSFRPLQEDIVQSVLNGNDTLAVPGTFLMISANLASLESTLKTE